MNNKVTMAMVAILAILGTYTFLYERAPKAPEAETSASADEVSLVKFDNADLKALTVTSSDGQLSIERVKGKWQNKADQKELDTEKIDGALRAFNDLKSRRKVSDNVISAELPTYGLDKPRATVSFDWRDAKKEPKSVAFGNDNLEKTGYYTKTDPGSSVFVTDRYAIDQLAVFVKTPPPAPPSNAAAAAAPAEAFDPGHDDHAGHNH
jgi:hypothetical protein